MRLLDLFCGAGGAAVGYWRAGFEVVGVDIDLFCGAGGAMNSRRPSPRRTPNTSATTCSTTFAKRPPHERPARPR